MNNGRGRPLGGRTDARERLVAAAHISFLRLGYAGTTVRGVAAACGVDPALIAYHFGSKRGLFAEAVRVPMSPNDVLDAALGDGPMDARRILAAVLDVWEHPHTGPPLRALAETALSRPDERRLLREYLERELVPAVSRRLSGRQRERRSRAACYVLAGVVLGHYVLGMHAEHDRAAVFADALVPLAAALAGPPAR